MLVRERNPPAFLVCPRCDHLGGTVPRPAGARARSRRAATCRPRGCAATVRAVVSSLRLQRALPYIERARGDHPRSSAKAPPRGLRGARAAAALGTSSPCRGSVHCEPPSTSLRCRAHEGARSELLGPRQRDLPGRGRPDRRRDEPRTAHPRRSSRSPRCRLRAGARRGAEERVRHRPAPADRQLLRGVPARCWSRCAASRTSPRPTSTSS